MAPRIAELNQRQVARLGSIREEWLRHRLPAGETDRRRAEAAIRHVYAHTGAAPPAEVLWCGSPMAGAIAALWLARVGGRRFVPLREPVWSVSHRAVGRAAATEVMARVRQELWWEVGGAAWRGGWGHAVAQVWREHRAATRAARDRVRDATWRPWTHLTVQRREARRAGWRSVADFRRGVPRFTPRGIEWPPVPVWARGADERGTPRLVEYVPERSPAGRPGVRLPARARRWHSPRWVVRPDEPRQEWAPGWEEQRQTQWREWLGAARGRGREEFRQIAAAGRRSEADDWGAAGTEVTASHVRRDLWQALLEAEWSGGVVLAHDVAERLRRTAPLPDRDSVPPLPRQVWERAWTQMRLQLLDRRMVRAGEAGHGPHDLGWLAYCAFFERSGVQHRATGARDAMAQAALAAGWWWALEDVLVASELPVRVARDDADRLHAEDGPAVAYPDGWGVYAWHGVLVPARVVRSPGSLSVEAIMREPDLEVRRVMVERMGVARYIREVGATPVHHDSYGTLYRVQVPGGREDVAVVRVLNATLEPDGTRKEYWVRVPPWMRRARQAVAWTFGVAEEEYAPAHET